MANEWRFGRQSPASRALSEVRRTIGSSVVSQAVRTARQTYSRGSARPIIPGAAQLASAYQRGGVAGFIRLAGGPQHARTWKSIERYAAATRPGQTLVQQFLKELGPLGAILGQVVGRSGGTARSGDVKNALDFIGKFASEPQILSALQRVLEGRGAQVVWPEGSQQGGESRDLARDLVRNVVEAIEHAQSQPGSSGGGKDSGRGGRGRGGGGGGGGRAGGEGGGGDGDDHVEINVDGRMERYPRNHPLVTGEMIETPQSSNVYSFGFDNDSHSLFVRFKDGRPAGGGGYKIKRVYGGGGPMTGEGPGHGKPHRPGPLYLYHNVPAYLFLTLLSADSKGNWVWDHLRIRGTYSGHQFDYALVGVQGAYVPRKATLTPAGEEFIPRSIFTDKGRELVSSMPQELVRPLRPIGRPPNDGRNGLRG